MTSVLAQICADKAEYVARRKKRQSQGELLAAAKAMAKARGFAASLEKAVRGKGIGLIAEIKRASPSKGIIRAGFDPAMLAASLEKGGASCLSVLTDEPYFLGSDDILIKARAASRLPVLRKDFMLDVYQIVESRAIGADAVLLIMAILDASQAAEMQSAAHELGMDALVEVHNEAEMEMALGLNSRLIGANNRDLSTFRTDLALTERLAPMVPPGHLLVSESGLATPADLARMARCGVHCFLIGETLMRRDDVEAAARELTSLAKPFNDMRQGERAS